jgi:hypothetical protein
MSTVFKDCDSISRYVPLTGSESIIDSITDKTTPVKFEKMRKIFPRFQLWHPERVERCTVLHKAAQEGNGTLIRYLLNQAPELLERGDSSKGYTPLCYALDNLQLDAMETLLALGANPNMVISNGFFKASLLHLAASAQLTAQQYGMHIEAAKAAQSVKLLLKYGAVRHPQDDSSKGKMIESIIQKASVELAEEREEEQREVRETVLDSKLLPPSVLCRLVSEYI